jgi:polyphosphate kinase
MTEFRSRFINRELSWLEFNSRVLDEARDPKTPLLERIRFFCIFHSNLDEFFMVRVASILRRVEDSDPKPDPSELSPGEQLIAVTTRSRELRQAVSTLYRQRLLPALAKEGIRLLRADEISEVQNEYLDDYFASEVYPILTPVAVDPRRVFPRVAGLAVNLAVLLDKEGDEGEGTRLAIVQVPSGLPGLCRLPSKEGLEYCWLGDVVRRRLSRLFPGYRIRNVAGFRVTRDAEMDMDDEGRDDYVRMLESELRKRRRGKPVRLEYEEEMAPELLRWLTTGIKCDQLMTIPVRGPLDPRPLLQLAELPGFDRLRFAPQPPLSPLEFDTERSIFDVIRERDILLHHPYDSFDPTLALIVTAADDADVMAIKQVLYRTSGKSSPLLKSLVRAAEQGKQVTVLLELTARFDEERNIGWARDLVDAGAHVIYGIADLKVHAKIALVVRREPDGLKRYVHLGTGNYNEKTARLYTDFGMLTANEQIGADASGFFNAITGYSEAPEFRRLVMAPNGMRGKLVSLIRREASRARSGQVSGILGKMNSLLDPEIIDELYEASRAGVPISLNIRGVCALRPGVPDLSERIRVVSIVDRYLEHGRAFVFRNGGDTEVYLASADWMPRNLDRRVELMFPVVDESCRQKVQESLEVLFADNQKSRLLAPDGTYSRLTPGRGEALRCQERLYEMLDEARTRARSVMPVRFEPIVGEATV